MVRSSICIKIHSTHLCVLVAVKSVSIQDTIGKENEEMALICTASGGRPLPSITWSMPENVEYVTEEETNILVAEMNMKKYL